MKKLLLVLLLLPALAQAQTVVADRFRMITGPCILTGQDGSPDKIVLTGNCSGITTSPATNLTLTPTGDLITDPVGNDILPEANYDINIGMLSKKYLTLHAAELWVETLVAQNTIATIGGRVLVAPTNILTVDLAPSTTTISVKYNNLASGDRIYMEANASVEFMAVTSAPSGSGPYTYSVTRNLDSSGANQWYAGDALLNTGTTGNGFIDLYSTDGVLSGSGPTIVGNVRTGSAYNAYAARWAIGNLNGLYNYGTTTYGAAFGDAAATNVTVDATNGFRIRSGTANKFVADTSGNLSIVGDLSVGTAGVIRSGATDYANGVGWIMEYNGGTPRFRIGNPAGNKLSWDGTTLLVQGQITATTGTIGGWTIGATSLRAGSGATTVGLDSGGSNPAIYAGSATPGSAPFRVTAAGAMTTTSGSIGGCSISSTTVTCGAASLDSTGISITTGSGATNSVKWSDGSSIYGNSGNLVHTASSQEQFNVASVYLLRWGSDGLYSLNENADLGRSADPWPVVWIKDDIKWSSPPDTTADDYPMVYSTGNVQIYRKTDGFNGTCSSPSSIDIERGIVVGCS